MHMLVEQLTKPSESYRGTLPIGQYRLFCQGLTQLHSDLWSLHTNWPTST